MGTNLYYQESGIASNSSKLKMLGAGVGVGIPLSAIYSYIVNWMPIVHLSFVLTLFLGAITGLVIGKIAYKEQVRSLRFVKQLTIFVSLITIYTAWVFTVFAFFDSKDLDFNHFNIVAAMLYFSEYGAWSVSNYTPTGWELYLIWAIEAIAIIIAAIYAAKSGYGIAPFCESCASWNKEEIVTSRLSAISLESKKSFVKELEHKNFDVLTNLRNTTESATEWMLVEIFNCSTCSKWHYLTIIHMTSKTGSKGQVKETFHTILENLILDEEDYLQIQAWRKKINAVDAAVLDIDLESRGERR